MISNCITQLGGICRWNNGQPEIISMGDLTQAACDAICNTLPADEETFRSLALLEQPALVAALTPEQLQTLNDYQNQLVDEERSRRYSAVGQPAQGSSDSKFFDEMADHCRANNICPEWLAARDAIQAAVPRPPSVSVVVG